MILYSLVVALLAQAKSLEQLREVRHTAKGHFAVRTLDACCIGWKVEEQPAEQLRLFYYKINVFQ